MDRAFYKQLVEKSLTGYACCKIICSDEGIPVDYEFIEINKAFEKLTGLKSIDTVGRKVTGVLPNIKLDSFDWIKFYGDVAMNGGEKELEQFSNALNRWYRVRSYSPRKYYFIMLFDDITKEKIVAEEIVKDRKFFEMIYDNDPDAILTISLNDGLIINANQTFADQLGFSIADLVGKSCHETNICVDPDEYQEIANELAEKCLFENREVSFRRKDGSIFTGLISGKTVTINSGLYGFYSIHNISDLKTAEDSLRASETRYRRLFESAKDGILILDADTGMIQDVNPFLEKLLGFTKEQMLNKALWQIGLLKDRIYSRENFAELQRDEYIRYEDLPLETIDGRRVNVEFVSNVYLVGEKKVIQCNIRDITERKIAEKLLRESEKKYSDYIENAPDGVFVVDEKGDYVEVNRTATLLTGYSRDDLLSMNIMDITAGSSLTAAAEQFNILLETGSLSGELQFIHKDGSQLWWSVDAVKLSNHRFLGFSSDITKRKEMEESLIFNNYHDQLTGLYNRRFFEKSIIENDLESNLPITLVTCDINGLKLVNDSLGQETGNNLLKLAADIIKKESRSEDIVARISGDSFSVILLRMNAREADDYINRIKRQVLKQNHLSVVFSISFGYATKTNHTEKIQEILTIAEDFLFKHKLYDSASMRSRSVDLIMSALFEKSNREMQHSQRVSELCEMISGKIYNDKESIRKVKLAGLIHDIGKIGIDEKILNKPDKLNHHEWQEIIKHPDISWRILSSINEFMDLANCILEHHERWDGKGYPKGLAGEQISLEARIIALADSFDAMTSERSYRKRMSNIQAIDEIKKNSGTQFDPKIVEVFIDLIKSKMDPGLQVSTIIAESAFRSA